MTAELEVRNLRKQFGSLTAVDGVSLSVPAGERHAVIGPNGAGKTTLFDLVTGAVSPDCGRVLLDGRDVTALTEDARARRGVVRSFQLTELFDGLSVRENLRLAVGAGAGTLDPLRAPDPALAERAGEWLDDLGIDADPAAPAATLSHGDRKRLEVGTALATDPDVLLLDEPTSGVPDGESAPLLDLVADATGDRTVLLIEHDVDAAFAFADRVTVLDRGSVVASGTPDAVADDDAVQAAYLGGYHGAGD